MRAKLATRLPSRPEARKASAGLLEAFLGVVKIGKRRARVKAYEARHADKSLRVVAEWCGVAPNTVKTFRDERTSVVQNCTTAEPSTTIGRDGKRRPPLVERWGPRGRLAPGGCEARGRQGLITLKTGDSSMLCQRPSQAIRDRAEAVTRIGGERRQTGRLPQAAFETGALARGLSCSPMDPTDRARRREFPRCLFLPVVSSSLVPPPPRPR